MTRQQRILTSFSWLNAIRFDSGINSSNDSEDISIPKMNSSSEARLQYIEAVDKLIDEYNKQKHTLNDFKLLNEIHKNKELSNINLETIDEVNNNLQWSNRLDSYQNVDPKVLSSSLNQISIYTTDLLHTIEEQKASSPKSWLSESKYVQDVNQDAVQYFDETED